MHELNHEINTFIQCFMLGVDWANVQVLPTTQAYESKKSKSQRESEKNTLHLRVSIPHGTSYTFGPHVDVDDDIQGYKPYFYFKADERVILCRPQRIPVTRTSPPAWLIADWILAEKRGEPLSEYAQHVIESTKNHPSLSWLH